jgi:sn-glycerol 3-phosphate transport system ATP-binding protein
MDEPLSNLDAKLRNEMRTEIRSLQQRLGMSVIYVTHDQVEAMSMADRIVLMNDGKIEQIDVPEGLYNKPKTIFTAQFIGSPPMNIMHRNNQCLGVRPEHIEIAEAGVSAQVVSCDYHGADTIVLAEIAAQEDTPGIIKIRYPGHALFAARQSISVHWRSEHEHLFPVNQ